MGGASVGTSAQAAGGTLPDAPEFSLPPVGLRVSDVALVINESDPASVETGAYYAARRGIADDHMIRVRFPPGTPVMSRDDFLRVDEWVRHKAPPGVQALALAWTLPYRVECMSVTSAFALGFDPAYCANGCKPTKPSRYFDSDSAAPLTDLGVRPAMLLAGESVDAVKALIDRGVRSDDVWPAGTAYLVSTGDKRRNVRAATFGAAQRQLAAGYPVVRVTADELADKPDVMFLFTGSKTLGKLESNRFLDGAIGDHLTSFGGMLVDSPQTSVLAWLSAGATGSYGSTTEPCNYLEKFPQVDIVMGRYVGGETLVEAYWKSVRMPGQGVFVGDPLARPFGGMRWSRQGRGYRLLTHLLRPGDYLLQASSHRVGPYRNLGALHVQGYGAYELRLPAEPGAVYRLLRVPTR